MENFPLSHSSATTLKGCEQRYHYYKVDEFEKDADVEEGEALRIGKAFHKVLELSWHEKPKDVRKDLATCVKDGDILLPENRINLVHAMVIKYLRLHKRLGRKVKAIEFEYRTDSFIGYIDALMEDDSGWYICDLKTAKTVFDVKILSLTRDPQLNLYTAYMRDIAELYGLDPAKFRGCLYRVATKPAHKQKVGEADIDFVKRLVKAVKVQEVFVPFERMAPDERLAEHNALHKRSMELRSGSTPSRNYNNCSSFFTPCPYWSRCYGDIYSNMPANLVIEKEV